MVVASVNTILVSIPRKQHATEKKLHRWKGSTGERIGEFIEAEGGDCSQITNMESSYLFH